ncbi:MAG: hypothetical protein O8C55_12325 [Candidatus Methanoperedens sp.]|nr:hypothetical protein [Candidatus Methanoperedens sp.]
MAEEKGEASKAVAKTDAQKALEIVGKKEMAVKPEDVKKAPAKAEEKAATKEQAKEAEPKVKAEARKEPDPSKEFVDAIMTEMTLKGASKKRLIRTLAEQYNFDKQKVMFRLKRALITERYAAAVAEGGHGH